MKKGIGLLWALIILVLVSFMMVFIAKVSFITVKHSSESYAIQRGELFMQSCIENTLLAIQGYERNSSSKCLENISFKDSNKRFECNVSILKYYCTSDANCPCDNKVVIQTPFSNGYVLMKIFVTSNKDNIKLTKTTLQRP